MDSSFGGGDFVFFYKQNKRTCCRFCFIGVCFWVVLASHDLVFCVFLGGRGYELIALLFSCVFPWGCFFLLVPQKQGEMLPFFSSVLVLAVLLVHARFVLIVFVFLGGDWGHCTFRFRRFSRGALVVV